MEKRMYKLTRDDFPLLLQEINDPPPFLYAIGESPRPENKVLCVVGSRMYTPYGKEVCERLIQGLAGYPITIVSGLAYGVDSIAHKAALEAGLQTIAVPGSGLNPDVLYPSAHRKLAEKIVAAGGGLLSEFEPDFVAAPWGFPQRNRIMAGLSHAVLVVEARTQSGTLITSKYATDYNREVLAVPGSILSKHSEGPHMLVKLGAVPVTSHEDILHTLGIALSSEKNRTEKYAALKLSPEEYSLLAILETPRTKEEVVELLKLPIHAANTLLSLAELKGIVTQKSGKIYLR